MDSNEEKEKTGQPHSPVDIKSILLPKKDAPSLDSAQRVNAGFLLEQEQSATLPKPEKKEEPPAPKPKKDEWAIQPLQTYQGDIERTVGEKKVSVVSIASAEANKRAETAKEVGELIQKKPIWPRVLMTLFGILLLAGSAAAIWYVVVTYTPLAVPAQPVAPFTSVDSVTDVTLAIGEPRTAAMQALNAARTGVKLSLGLVSQLRVLVPTGTSSEQSAQQMSLPTLLTLLSPSVPQELLRTLDPQYYLLGVHSFDENQAFLIMHADAYQTAYSAMLNWENTMADDLAPLFTRTARPHIEEEAPVASSSPAVLPTQFVDRIVGNRDTRVLQNVNGDILLLWTFLDRGTIVITTNESTLGEVISRLSVAPIVRQP